MLPLQGGRGHVSQDHRRSTPPRPYLPTLERVLKVFLLLGPALKRRGKVILIKVLHPQRRSDGVLGGPADRREAGPLGSDTRQNEKQGEGGPALGAKDLEQPDALGKRLERKQHSEDRATDGGQCAGEALELPLEGTAPGRAPLWRPGGQIGEGPRPDLGPVTEGFT